MHVNWTHGALCPTAKTLEQNEGVVKSVCSLGPGLPRRLLRGHPLCLASCSCIRNMLRSDDHCGGHQFCFLFIRGTYQLHEHIKSSVLGGLTLLAPVLSLGYIQMNINVLEREQTNKHCRKRSSLLHWNFISVVHLFWARMLQAGWSKWAYFKFLSAMYWMFSILAFGYREISPKEQL